MDGFEDVFAHVARNYDYYPNTAIQLCAISYAPMQAIPGEVSSSVGLRVVWGPSELTDWDGVSYSRAFVAGDSATGDYFVVIRGTNFESLTSWLKQDFDLDKARPFGALPGAPADVPSDALIAQGAFNGMSDLLRLRDPQTGASLVEYAATVTPPYLYVTGHSLGGTLAPTLFAYLHAALYGSGPSRSMALWSFAGLTAGGAGFNDYFNSLLPDSQGFLWRIHNSFDVAPLCWWSFDGVRQIYDSYQLHWDFIERDLLERLMSDATRSDISYAPAQPGLQLEGTFDQSVADRDHWLGQALHQHHPVTYQALVKARYPQPVAPGTA
jgi:hypothetical protein